NQTAPAASGPAAPHGPQPCLGAEEFEELRRRRQASRVMVCGRRGDPAGRGLTEEAELQLLSPSGALHMFRSAVVACTGLVLVVACGIGTSSSPPGIPVSHDQATLVFGGAETTTHTWVAGSYMDYCAATNRSICDTSLRCGTLSSAQDMTREGEGTKDYAATSSICSKFLCRGFDYTCGSVKKVVCN